MNITDVLLKTGFLHTEIPTEWFEEGDLSKARARELPQEVFPLSGEISHLGRGSLSIQSGMFSVSAPITREAWPPEQQPDGDYCSFGQTGILLCPKQTDWQGYTRLRFEARPTGALNRVPMLYVQLKNTGEIAMPDTFGRTGMHQISLSYGEWNDCVWELTELPRDRIVEMTVSLPLNGTDHALDGMAGLEIKNIRLEKAGAYQNAGWSCGDEIAFSQSGYRLGGRKTAVTMKVCESFVLEKKNGEKFVYPAKCVTFRGESYYLLDFSAQETAGEYRIVAGEQMTAWFPIAKEPFMPAILKLCNFIFGERCGYPIPGKHGLCHSDVTVSHAGKTMIYNGGWHDAGDLSQQTLQTGEIAGMLYRAADLAKAAGETLLCDRLYEEARWGTAFVLKTRFGDGYRATSAGLTRYTRGLLGDMDDVFARCHNNAFENLLLSAVESDAAAHERELDRSLSDALLQAAREDFFFGLEELPSAMEKRPSFFEHSYASSQSLHDAALVYAAANLLKAQPDAQIAALLAEYTDKLLACQETGDTFAVSGFFYRDETHEQPVHFNHQSREHLFALALSGAYEMLNGAQKDRVYAAMRLYGGYFKQLMGYASPYGMIPAGIQRVSEVEDEKTFTLLHLMTDYESQKQSFIAQVKAGVPVGGDGYIRQFPVWFSFRGNTAVQLSQGMGARVLSAALGDSELAQIADEQLYFVCGKNPFAQSLIYGEGSRFAPQYAAHAGQMVGEIPVGIETDGDADEPFYPEAVNATYKEVWTSSAARFLGTL